MRRLAPLPVHRLPERLERKEPAMTNRKTILALEQALEHQRSRTADREARGVEGTHKP